jgi:multiple sugar transport system substrate-binding protein
MQRLTWRPRPVQAGMTALAVAAVLTAAACGSSGTTSDSAGAGSSATASSSTNGSCSPNATKINFWAWAPGYNLVVNEFNKTHPNICVEMNDVGGANDEYVKLSAALKSGNGAPDVAEVEYIELPTLEITNDLLNLVPYGINQYKSQYVPSAWAQVSQGSAVYAMPGDIGPLGLYYNSKLFAKYKITPPTTWAQFATDAATLHKDDPSAYITNFAATDTEWLLTMMQQYGAFPLAYTGGSKVTVDFDGPKQLAFASYWDNLLKSHEVNSTTDFSTAFWNNLDNGTDASWPMAAWGPGYMASNMKQSVGDWRAAPIPQVNASDPINGSWGGSTAAVMKTTQHPAQAAEFAEWFFGNMTAWQIHANPIGAAFPGYTPLLNSASFQNATIPLSGSSKPKQVFAAAAKNITNITWAPFMEEIMTEGTPVFAGVLNGSETIAQALQQMQSTVTKYATQQGFTVSQ